MLVSPLPVSEVVGLSHPEQVVVSLPGEKHCQPVIGEPQVVMLRRQLLARQSRWACQQPPRVCLQPSRCQSLECRLLAEPRELDP